MAALPTKNRTVRSQNRGWIRRLLPLVLLGLGLGIGFLGPYVWIADRQVRAAFGRLTWQVPTRVLAQPLELLPEGAMTPETLEAELAASRYMKVDAPRRPGSYARQGGKFTIATRGFSDLDGAWPAQQVAVTLGGGRVRSIRSGDRALARVRLEDVPPLLVTTLQAVEDRGFKHHRGIDWRGILRAAWVNLRHGELRQGASTLTQQLVKNFYLTR